jgi:hypothetical protein
MVAHDEGPERAFPTPDSRIEELDRRLKGELQELRNEQKMVQESREVAEMQLRQIEDAIGRFDAALAIVSDGRTKQETVRR